MLAGVHLSLQYIIDSFICLLPIIRLLTNLLVLLNFPYIHSTSQRDLTHLRQTTGLSFNCLTAQSAHLLYNVTEAFFFSFFKTLL